jgi:DNA-binding protein HU-beta
MTGGCVNRSQLVKAVAAQTGQDAKTVDTTLRGFTDVVTGVASKGEPVAISGFAKFARVETKARMGRNPATGEPVKIKASKRVRITALKAFKDAVLTPSLAPKLLKGVWPPEAAPASRAPAKAAVKKVAAVRKAPAAKAPAATRAASARKAPAAKKR